jgi:Carboxypeptidase regulatory-like domain
MLMLLGIGGCRRGVPVIDPTAPASPANGTISGILQGPDGTTAVEGRAVEAINVETGERQTLTTSVNGGFTFKLAPGKYRLSVALLPGETILRDPGVIDLNSSDLDAQRDIVIGTVRRDRQHSRQPTIASGLGSPIA